MNKVVVFKQFFQLCRSKKLGVIRHFIKFGAQIGEYL
jgi:hypothetical protein